MKIVIMRHGEATFSSSDRILSKTGILEAETVGKLLAQIIKIDRCFASPKTRAVQTAEIVKSNAFECLIEIESMLTPSGDPDEIISYIDATCRSDENLLIVSHLPLVELLSYELAKRHISPPSFSTACALLIDYSNKNTVFEAFISPRDGIKYF